MELETHALALLPLVLVASLAMFLQPAVATHGMPRPSGGFSLRLVPSAGWNSTMHVDGGGFLHLNEQAATTALRPHVHGPRELTYSVATTVGTGRGRRTYDLVLDTVSSLTWMQCLPIAHPFPQIPPPFNPEISSSFSRVSRRSDLCHKPSRGTDCEFRAPRLDGAHASGVLGNETFAFADDGGRAAATEVGGVVFGCAHTATRFHNHGVLAGVLGLGKQRPSVIWTRLHQHGQDGRFSYYLFRPAPPVVPLPSSAAQAISPHPHTSSTACHLPTSSSPPPSRTAAAASPMWPPAPARPHTPDSHFTGTVGEGFCPNFL